MSGGPGRTVWRLTTARHAGRAFDGEGARLYGGRWNHPGTPLVYTSATLSLAALELVVHFQQETLPDDLVAIRARLPPGLRVGRLDRSLLPEDWRRHPAPEALKDLGSAWQRSGRSAPLEVPSALIPQESNVLLNPIHRAIQKLEIDPPEPFSFDSRMWKGP
ncbi:MAG: RES family NAD+ phosphorylase [Thermoanaerobaculia bacterium]